MNKVICREMLLALSTSRHKGLKLLNFFMVRKAGRLLYLIFLLSAAIPTTIQGQNRNNLRPSTLDWIAERINNASDTTQVFIKLHESLLKFEEENKEDKLAQTHKYLSIWHNLYGKMDSAVFYLRLTIPFYENTQQKDNLAQIYLQLSEYLSSKADYAEAMDGVFEALELYQEAENQRGIALCYTGLCDYLYSQYKFEEGNE